MLVLVLRSTLFSINTIVLIVLTQTFPNWDLGPDTDLYVAIIFSYIFICSVANAVWFFKTKQIFYLSKKIELQQAEESKSDYDRFKICLFAYTCLTVLLAVTLLVLTVKFTSSSIGNAPIFISLEADKAFESLNKPLMEYLVVTMVWSLAGSMFHDPLWEYFTENKVLTTTLFFATYPLGVALAIYIFTNIG